MDWANFLTIWIEKKMKKLTKIEVIKELSKMRDFLYKNVGWDEWSKADKEVYHAILKYIDEEAEKNENL